jgi:hypothetical protein
MRAVVFKALPMSGIAVAFALVAASVPVNGYSEPNAAVTNSAPANADDPFAHYRAYEAAISAGNIQAASEAAQKAWRTGERVWNGDNPNLPGLAFNAAWTLGLLNKTAEAREPALRAVALAAQYPDKVNIKEAQFLATYATLVAQPSRGQIDAFDTAAKALEGSAWDDFLLARSYSDAARIALNFNQARKAQQFVARGLAETQRLGGDNSNLRTNFQVMQTMTSLQLGDYRRAVTEAVEARRIYGRPKSERDLNWASLAAWEAAARSVYLSRRLSPSSTGTRIQNREDAPPDWNKDELRALSGGPEECRDIELKRSGRDGPQGITFPASEMSDGMVGGAIVKAQLDQTGHVLSTDILASLPRPVFGSAAAQGISGWRYELPPGLPEQCRFVNVTVMYVFENY